MTYTAVFGWLFPATAALCCPWKGFTMMWVNLTLVLAFQYRVGGNQLTLFIDANLLRMMLDFNPRLTHETISL
ncbi:hypothetical protein [Pseudovibrio sp. Tun.PSC04-5.I4]|uniref:hypothetical protein n=1 Tax=Pseudovibrio sp. Tun.PSC04-5.I4 TaxID=1798213 RepID=UPI0013566578|nr:hypothetical protein [Pseudovibrio sp. Tun.PSC04-5.I4]